MRRIASLICVACAAAAQEREPRTREMNDLNWMEFRELVPARIHTVLLPTGTLEAHGVVNNGADNTAPLAIARAIAADVGAVVAPALNYGITGSLDAYAGGFSISESAYRSFVTDLLRGLARQGFRNVVIVNGHGGPQTNVLRDVAEQVGRSERVRTLLVNWWSTCSAETTRVFGEDGGHAGWNETAFVQAIDPALVRRERYSDSLAQPRPAEATWSAYPFPSSIILYQPKQGYVKFDDAKAKTYFGAVVGCVRDLVKDTIARWDRAGIFEK
ncbi:MAG TPA: creatininase family protein [Bryobacteraceae bacterium]|nr:creatininase family protein [Bryobacteraceae bacterium]